MASVTLRVLLGPRSAGFPALTALCASMGSNISVVDPFGKPLLGETSAEVSAGQSQVPVQIEDATLGFVIGPPAPAAAVALLLTHLAARESEGRALASEVLHLYREVHLI
jgi:hypothetical protein